MRGAPYKRRPMEPFERRFWNLYAHWYDRLGDLIPYADLQREIIETHLADLGKKARVLDAGCGTGRFLHTLHVRRPDLVLTGIDRSGTMLDVARNRLTGTNTTLRQTDMNGKLPFADASFDAVVCVHALYALSSPAAFLTEARRILTPSGRIVISNPWKPAQSFVWLEHLRQIRKHPSRQNILLMLRNAPAYATIVAINALIARRARNQTYHFLSMDALSALLHRVGFAVEASRTDAYGGICCLVRACASYANA